MADVTDIGKGLGRYYARDDRDEQYMLRTMIPTDEPDRTWRYYVGGTVLDQGATPQCVGYTWRQWANSSVMMARDAVQPMATKIYEYAQTVDEWEGTNYDGTSVRAGAKAMQWYGMIESYVWANDVDECRRFILHGLGTLCLGTAWYRDMTNLQSGGIARPTGQMQGGHAYLAIGYNDNRGAFRCVNSWGNGWGQSGRFWLLGEDLERLLDDYGEACAATQRRRS